MTFGLVAEWLSRRIKFGLSRFTIALGGYKLILNYKNDPTKMKGVQGCADHNYHESDRISLRTYSEAFPTGQKTVDFFSDQHGPRPL